MYYGMQYDPIQGEGQGHETLRWKSGRFYKLSLPPFTKRSWQLTTDS